MPEQIIHAGKQWFSSTTTLLPAGSVYTLPISIQWQPGTKSGVPVDWEASNGFICNITTSRFTGRLVSSATVNLNPLQSSGSSAGPEKLHNH